MIDATGIMSETDHAGPTAIFTARSPTSLAVTFSPENPGGPLMKNPGGASTLTLYF